MDTPLSGYTHTPIPPLLIHIPSPIHHEAWELYCFTHHHRSRTPFSIPPPSTHTHTHTYTTQAWELYCRVFRSLSAQLTALKSLHLRHVAPRLLAVCGGRALELAVPGVYIT